MLCSYQSLAIGGCAAVKGRLNGENGANDFYQESGFNFMGLGTW